MWKCIFGIASGLEIMLGAAMTLWPKEIPTEAGIVLLIFGAAVALGSAIVWYRETRGRKLASANVGCPVAKDPRTITDTNRKKLVVSLAAAATDHSNVKITFGPAQYHPVAQLLDGVFAAANWQTNTNLTPQDTHNPQYREGVEVMGFNRHLADTVQAALVECGVSDAYTRIEELKVPRENPKWTKSQQKIYIHIGHVKYGAR